MISYSQAEILRLMRAIRRASRSNLPVDSSFIPFDILLNLLQFHQENQPVSIKTLFASLPYSDMGVRYHFRRLVKNGWVKLEQSPFDSRSKICVPTEKLLSSFSSITLELSKFR